MTSDNTDSQNLCLDPHGGLPRLLEIMRRLRDPKTGCPWDIKQTYKSIAPYTIEEAYEVADAIERNNISDLEGELGDLLLQVVYYAQIGTEDGHFDFKSIIKSIADKMIHRHPHIFNDTTHAKSADQQTIDWETAKQNERQKINQTTRTLDGIAMNLPALTRAVKLQKRAARIGFDWPSTDQVLDKIHEESCELSDACRHLSSKEQNEEFGDLMFVMANLARHLHIDPEESLRGANAKFLRRFEMVEDKLYQSGKTPEQASLDEMDAAWNQVKTAEKCGKINQQD